jgi:hypothetical protein
MYGPSNLPRSTLLMQPEAARLYLRLVCAWLLWATELVIYKEPADSAISHESWITAAGCKQRASLVAPELCGGRGVGRREVLEHPAARATLAAARPVLLLPLPGCWTPLGRGRPGPVQPPRLPGASAHDYCRPRALPLCCTGRSGCLGRCPRWQLWRSPGPCPCPAGHRSPQKSASPATRWYTWGRAPVPHGIPLLVYRAKLL